MRTCSYSPCKRQFEPRTPRQRYCWYGPCRDRQLGRKPRVRRGTTCERGYNAAHRRERERWKPIVDRGEATCCRCGWPIIPGTVWHLDHEDHDRSRYRGVAHGTCNVRAGAVKGNRLRAQAFTSSAPRIAR